MRYNYLELLEIFLIQIPYKIWATGIVTTPSRKNKYDTLPALELKVMKPVKNINIENR